MAYGLSRGVQIKITDKNNEIMMADKPFVLEKTDKKYVSFFAFGGNVEGFSVYGLKYEAVNMSLDCDMIYATSNEFIDAPFARIDFKKGRLIVMMCNDMK